MTKSRLEEVEELLKELNERIYRELYGSDYISGSTMDILIDEKVALEIEKHDLLNKSQ